MTDIYVELDGTRAIAWSPEWPGWCRIRTSEAEVVQALIDTEYIPIGLKKMSLTDCCMF